MYLIESVDEKKLQSPFFQTTAIMFGVKIPAEANRCEIWGTTFHDPKPDCCEYRFYKDHTHIASSQVAGY